MTVTLERAPVVMTTADGESRPAEMWGQDSWTCGFCQSPTFGPADWEQHERDNEAAYAKTGEAYAWEPYAGYRRDYWERRACSNPGCVSTLTGKYLADYRKREADRLRREEDHARWQRAQDEVRLMAQLEREAADAKRQRLTGQGPLTREAGEQLGFAWHCFAGEHEASGYDRGEYGEHFKSHGKRALKTSYVKVRLRKVPAAAKMPALEVNVFKWARWHQEHTPEATCQGCSHTINQHKAAGSTINGTAYDCRECGCEHVYFGDFRQHETQQADTRGQYLANGPAPHSVWAIPFEAAPWEDGTAAPVLLYAGSPSRYFTDAYSAKYDRKSEPASS
jgi:hypothetical protein